VKIDDRTDLSGISSPGAKGAAGVENASRQEGARGEEKAGADRAELSGRAGKIAQALGADAEKRAAEVERLRLEVASGKYNPDPAAIAKGIVSDGLAQAASAGSGKK
jgi:flagellar biosynthesis anti-sigma factor FlgM